MMIILTIPILKVPADSSSHHIIGMINAITIAKYGKHLQYFNVSQTSWICQIFLVLPNTKSFHSSRLSKRKWDSKASFPIWEKKKKCIFLSGVSF